MRESWPWLVGWETLNVRAASYVAKKDPVSHLSSLICQMGMRTAPALPPPTGRKGSGDLVGGTRLNDQVRGEQHFRAPWASVSSSVTAGLDQMTSKNAFSSGICNVDD